MRICIVPVTPRSVGLPEFHQGMRYRTPAVVQDAALHDDALSQRLTRMLPSQIVVRLGDIFVPVNWPGNF